MPSRFSPPEIAVETPPQHHRHQHKNFHLLPPLLAGTITITIILLTVLTIFIYRKLSRNRTAPSESPSHHHCRRFSYSLLRTATSSFSPSNLLGHGGFGSVYKGTLPSSPQPLAIKVMNSTDSLQGELEFHNELSLSRALDSPHIVPLIGFSSDSIRRRFVLVYELMENRSVQDALLDRKREELMGWSRRFCVINDVARGLEYLHHFCDPPVIHGDIKPSNILLDGEFKAKIGDFGLARLKSEDLIEGLEEGEVLRKKDVFGEDNGSILEETESGLTGFEEGASLTVADRSPESCVLRVLDSEASPAVSPEMGVEKGSVLSEGFFDKVSVESGRDLVGNKKGGSRRDWWWKQDPGGGSESGRVKDYVMEWIGNEIKKERPKNEWLASPGSVDNINDSKVSSWNVEQKKEKIRKKERNRRPREWWKEEFCEELTKKKKKKKRGLSSSNNGECWWQRDEEMVERKKKKKSSRGSIDRWLDGFSGEFKIGRRNRQDWANWDIPKSGGISSTPSMRGTVCYIAPEYGGGGGLLSEKCDVYSFGVLVLVIISGRRPLQVTASPMSEFERANLISWARQLAYNGRLLELVDPSIHSLDKDQALLCVTIALLCLQRSPSKRPTVKEIVEMLSGEAEPPHLPFEFSPSPPSNFLFKSRKKVR